MQETEGSHAACSVKVNSGTLQCSSSPAATPRGDSLARSVCSILQPCVGHLFGRWLLAHAAQGPMGSKCRCQRLSLSPLSVTSLHCPHAWGHRNGGGSSQPSGDSPFLPPARSPERCSKAAKSAGAPAAACDLPDSRASPEPAPHARAMCKG